MAALPAAAAPLDVDVPDWPRSLRAAGGPDEEAIALLRALLLRAARFEVARRRSSLPHVGDDELEDIALAGADGALVSVLRRLDDFRGDSRFSTWVAKFALLETAVKLRERRWQARDLPAEAEAWTALGTGDVEPDRGVERRQPLAAVQEAVTETLTPHERRVLVALALNDVPIDVLAERLETTRGALYETLQDARRKLRTHLGEPRPTA